MRTALLALLLASCVDPLAEVGVRWTCVVDRGDSSYERSACRAIDGGDLLVEELTDECVSRGEFCVVTCSPVARGARTCPDPSEPAR